MKKIFMTLAVLTGTIAVSYAQSYFDDDIYYNPKKDSSTTASTKTTKKQSAYIDNMAEMDVDAYNRRGSGYYASSVDTIGNYVSNGEDFVYTQQIQKYYNPTIVVDNANVLGDVLSNSYGNVDIVIDNGIPVFSPWYGWNSPYYSWWYNPFNWSINFGSWGWNVGFYNPWYNWAWGPSWTWGPSWAWGPGWGPSWGWGPGWGPNPAPPMANWRPNGNRPVGPAPGWAGSTRPGGNMNMAHRNPVGNSRPMGSVNRPMNGATQRPAGVVNNNGRWEYNTTGSTGHRVAGTGAVNSGNNRVNAGTINTTTNNSKTPALNGSSNRNTNRVGSTNRTTTTNRSSVGTSNRSTGVSRGGGGTRSTGGGGGGSRGRHR